MLELLMVAQLMCAPLNEVDAGLRDKYQERVLVTLPNEDAKIRIYVGDKSWTVIEVKGEVACLIGAGKGNIQFGRPGEDS